MLKLYLIFISDICNSEQPYMNFKQKCIWITLRTMKTTRALPGLRLTWRISGGQHTVNADPLLLKNKPAEPRIDRWTTRAFLSTTWPLNNLSSSLHDFTAGLPANQGDLICEIYNNEKMRKMWDLRRSAKNRMRDMPRTAKICQKKLNSNIQLTITYNKLKIYLKKFKYPLKWKRKKQRKQENRLRQLIFLVIHL